MLVSPRRFCSLVGIAIAASASASGQAAEKVPELRDWLTDYVVVDGFRIERDAHGFSLPTAIAIVPEPGTRPEDPLYFVTELRGTIKVVTNDRSVHTFATIEETVRPKSEVLDATTEVGMAGICLDPRHGYIFVSYVYEDADGLYRNALTRFETTPGVFAVTPARSQRLAAGMLDQHMSTVSHQIGPMVLMGDSLFVSVGDANVPFDARRPDSPNGKILRMDLEGRPESGNLFAGDDDPTRARNFVWALGFRNPFSLTKAEDRLFTADNGPSVDRFVEVARGRDYLYAGGDSALGTNSAYIWAPSVSPVQMDYNPPAAVAAGFPAPWQSRFLLTLSGAPENPVGPDPNTKAVIGINFNFETGRLDDVPAKLLQYVGPGSQLFVGLAQAAHGLYVVPMLPDVSGVSAILRLTYEPAAPHPHRLENRMTVDEVLERRSCKHCHNIDGRGIGIGPNISRRTLAAGLLARLEDPAYEERLDQIDRLRVAPFTDYRTARDAVRQARGSDKVRLWLKHRLLEPRFDQQVSQMPNLGMTEAEAELIRDWLLEISHPVRATERLRSLVPLENLRMMTTAFVVGIAVGALGLAGGVFLVRRRATRTRSHE